MIGQSISHYRIVEEIGRGGMGIVYKAHDTRLDRFVAIKAMDPAGFADETARQRFLREAMTAARVDHPYICKVYEVIEHNSRQFIVLEYVEGQPLSRLIADSQMPQSPGKVLDLAIEIAEALDAAHSRGVIHRDIKPSNIMVLDSGHIKILDFGLAKPIREAEGSGLITGTNLTASGAVLGTLKYMAPEQLKGQKVDGRSDLFSLGIVLYELVCGRMPFAGANLAEIVNSILSADPEPVRQSHPDVPPGLEAAILKMLAKDPARRHSSAAEVCAELKQVRDEMYSQQSIKGKPLTAAADATVAESDLQPAAPRARGRGRVRPWKKALLLASSVSVFAAILGIWFFGNQPVLSFAPRDWILVSDFDNQTGEPVFDKSLAAAFTVSLEQSTHANVFPRSRVAAALQRMGKAGTPHLSEDLGREICVREKIRGLISPAISKVGQSYSLTARIIDPATGDTVRSYIENARSADEILPLLGSLAATIRRSLGESLSQINLSNRDLPQVTTSSIEALSQYAEGSALWSSGKYRDAVQLYLSALKADPDFAMAHAAVGTAYYSHIFNNPVEAKKHFERALQLSQRTTQREAQVIEIEFESNLGHFDKAIALYEAYLKTYPDDYHIRYNYGGTLRRQRRNEEAAAQYREVLRLAPEEANAYINLATSYSWMGKIQESLEAYGQAFALQPGWITAGNLNHEYGFVWVRAGDLAKAEEIFKKGLATSNKPLSTRSLALLDMYRGKYRDARERLHEAILLNQSDKVPLSEARNHLFMAQAFEAEGRNRESLAALDAAARCIGATTGQPWLAARIGVAFARAGRLERAGEMLAKARREAEATDPQQASEIHRLEGEIELARGNYDKAVELVLLADREDHWALTVESMARVYRLGGMADKAVAAHEAFVAMQDGSLGWEPQQAWIEAHYWLAGLYHARGDRQKAAASLDRLFSLWKEADPALPMLKDARRLRAQIGGA